MRSNNNSLSRPSTGKKYVGAIIRGKAQSALNDYVDGYEEDIKRVEMVI